MTLGLFYKDNDLVVSATRHPKIISQVAENITIITAREIEALNANTVAEVLTRISGVIVQQNGRDFGSTSLISIHGSEHRHVLVLFDGMPLNFISGGSAETNSIPVEIIERIEIIKGPASSTWGSSLGGVINILSKKYTEEKGKPANSLRASYGDGDSHLVNGQISVDAGVNIYAYAGYKHSDGLVEKRYFKDRNFFGKVDIPLDDQMAFSLSAGCSRPDSGYGVLADTPSGPIVSSGDLKDSFVTFSFTSRFFGDTRLNALIYRFEQKFDQESPYFNSGELYSKYVYDEDTWGGNVLIAWEGRNQTVVIGADFNNGALDQRIFESGIVDRSGSQSNNRSVFINDTIVLDNISITPGIRFDHSDTFGSFLSPSLGITYAVDESTIFRLSISRGFTVPPLSWTIGGAIYMDQNPDLEPEEVWSHQWGLETSLFRYFWLKVNFFRHDRKKILNYDYNPPSPGKTFYFVNKGRSRTEGIEVGIETLPFKNFSVTTNLMGAKLRYPNVDGAENITLINIGVRYSSEDIFQAELLGNKVCWGTEENSRSDFLWELYVSKKVTNHKKNSIKIYLSLHNIFNSSQYIGGMQNPERWVETGITFQF